MVFLTCFCAFPPLVGGSREHLDMYFEDQFTLPGKTFHPHWNSDPSKIKKNNVTGLFEQHFHFLGWELYFSFCHRLCSVMLASIF
jgi:hypothetical protein